MARNFNGTSDKILMALGAIPTAPTALTFAAIVRIQAVSRWNNIITLATSADGLVANMTVDNSNRLCLEYAASNVPTVTAVGTGWQFLAITRVAGVAGAVRGHRYVFSTGVWTHTAGATVGDPSGTVARPYLGAAASTDFLSGDLEVGGFWNRVLSDADIENLPFTLQAWYAAAPLALWKLDQDAVAQKIKDAVGGADEATRTGTTIAAASVPVFNLGDGPIVVSRSAAGGGSAIVLDAVLAGSGGHAADLRVGKPLASVLAAAGGHAADLRVGKPLAAVLAGVGGATGVRNLTVGKSLAAVLGAAGAAVANLTVGGSSSAVLAATSAAAADLRVGKPLAAVLSATSTLQAQLRIGKPLAAVLAGGCTIAASLTVGVQAVTSRLRTLMGAGQ